MAIAFDAVTDSGNIVISPFTFSHTTTGTNRALFICIAYQSATVNAANSVTYNGVALTRATSVSRNFTTADIWYLPNPASGSNTISISGLDTVSGAAATAVSLTGVASTVLDGTNTGSGAAATSLSTSVTTSFANSWVLDCAAVQIGGSGITITSGGGQTQRSNINQGPNSELKGVATQIGTTAGSYSNSWTISTSENWSQAIVGIKALTSTNYPISASQGAYALTGESSILRSTRSILAAFASYTLTGQIAILRHGYGIMLAYGSYMLTGIATLLRTNKWIGQDKSSSSWSGENKSSSSWNSQNKS